MCIKTLIIYDHMVYATIYGTALLQTQTHLYAAFGFYKRICIGYCACVSALLPFKRGNSFHRIPKRTLKVALRSVLRKKYVKSKRPYIKLSTMWQL